ncbi:MAG: ribulose-phosphate 3-epimerase [Protaetiibacter sp.]
MSTRDPRDAAVRIQPSILSADFANMQRDVERIASADGVHVDVMDNHFVPNLTFGPAMVEAVQRVSPIPLDVHLMIDDADRWAPGYAELGVFSVTFHAEATEDPVRLARRIRGIGSRASLALKPGTPVEPYLDLLAEFDQMLVMTVEPGFGGQSFMADMMPKLRTLRSAAERHGIELWLQVDGGIALDTIGIAAEAGADTFVAGSAVYGAADVEAAIAGLRAAAAARHAH